LLAAAVVAVAVILQVYLAVAAAVVEHLLFGYLD
jgi:hypothetical protein